MAVEVRQVSPLPSPWAWREAAPTYARAAGPVSPEIRGLTLDDTGSFLPTMQSFSLAGEDESPLQRPAEEAGYASNSSLATPPHAQSLLPPHAGLPLERQRSGAEEIELFVEGAFDEMDEALARRQLAQQHIHPYGAAHPYEQHMHVRPSVEEQAWLDQVRAPSIRPCTSQPSSSGTAG